MLLLLLVSPSFPFSLLTFLSLLTFPSSMAPPPPCLPLLPCSLPFLLPCQPLLLASSSSPVSFHSLFLPAPYSLSSPFSPWLSLLRLLLLPTSSALPLQVL